MNNKFKRIFSVFYRKQERGNLTKKISSKIATMNNYDNIISSSKEFKAAEKNLGPYLEFGVSNIFGNLHIAIGDLSYSI